MRESVAAAGPLEIEEKDIPQGIPPSAIERLMTDRRKKLNYEKNIPTYQKNIKLSEKHKKWLEKKLTAIIERKKNISIDLKEKLDEDFKQKYNTHLILKLKQALVEVP